jgi:uncharacterized protein (TIGR00299 family) protein
MVLGALADAGLDFKAWLAEVEKLGLSGYTISKKKVKRAGLAGTKITIKVTQPQPARHLAEIERLIGRSKISPLAKENSLRVFRRLGEAEAKAHGVPVEKVHFHEVGAVDSIIDIVGTTIALEMIGIKNILSSPLNLGSGTVRFSHGTFPVPAPATAALVKGFPAYSSDIEAELTTPTGAALITTLAESAGPMHQMTTERIGYGAGGRELPEMPNMLRVFIGETAGAYEQDTVSIIEANIDDMDPRIYEYVMERLFKAGAVDVWLTPIVMKKSRPGVTLSVMADASKTSSLVDIIMGETTTFGVRIYEAGRRKLIREFKEVGTKYGKVSVKVGLVGGKAVKAVPEYEDVKAAAMKSGRPLREILDSVSHKEV